MRSDSDAEVIRELGMQQRWIYRFNLPSGLTTPGPINKGLKNIRKTQVIQQLNLRGKRVLDVGCAEGMFSFYMASEGARVTGIEVNEKRYEKAQFVNERLEVPGANFVLFDAENTQSWSTLEEKFDVGFCFSVIHRVSDPFNLIAQVAAKCETLVLEWKAPEGFLTNRISLAFHEVEGKLDPRNIKARSALMSDISIMDTGEEKPYWCPTIGAIKEITSSFGYRNFQVVKVSKFSALRVAYAYLDLFSKILRNKSQPVAWRRYQRVMLICTKESEISFDANTPIRRLSWDGTNK
jgi:SAM-dependent methyltransferase